MIGPRRSSLPLVILLALFIVALALTPITPPTDKSASGPAALSQRLTPAGTLGDQTGVVTSLLEDRARLRTTEVGGKKVNYCSNGSIDAPSETAKRVLFVIHGNDRQSCNIANAALAGATPEQRRTTLVVAPRFATQADRIDDRRQLWWTYASWSQGDPAGNADLPISSFEVLDELIRRAGSRPHVVAGFSGGGQFVNRFAAGSPTRAVRYVVVNPSSYLYFSPERPGTRPEQLRSCPQYDNYRYGLRRLNAYMERSGPDGLRERYAGRTMVYLLGSADADPMSRSMDTTCSAKLTGANRYDRGQRYWAYLPSVFGPQIRERQALYVVPDVAHDPLRMFRSPAGRQALFGEYSLRP